MDSYCELLALPNPEIIQSAVVAELIQVLHKRLPTYEGQIGLAFPGYGQQRTLGGIIRILGPETAINSLHQTLANETSVRDYALLTPVKPIPANIKKHICYERRQTKGNSHFNRLKKRHQQKGTWSEELESAVKLKHNAHLRLPHAKLQSASTGQGFLLFIQRKERPKPVSGAFNGYGLAFDGTTVPSF